MLPSFAKQTVTRLRPGITVSRGSEIPDWSHPDSKEIRNCSVQPGTTDMSLDGRVLGLLDGLTCYMPENADIREGDRVVYDGETYEVNGVPRRWHGVGNTSHTQVTLRRWEG